MTVLVLGEASQAATYRALLSPRGYAVEQAATLALATRAVAALHPRIVLWIPKDPQEMVALGDAIARLVASAEDGRAPCVVALAHTREPAHLRAALECKGLTALLALDEAGRPDARDLLVTIAQVSAPRVLQAGDYLTRSQVERSLNLTKSTEKDEALAIVRSVATETGCNPYMVSTVVNTAEEMISNAFYHAPVDGRGRHSYSALPRTIPITLPPAQRVTMTVASDDQRLCVSVLDRFGSLRVASLAARLATCLHPC